MNVTFSFSGNGVKREHDPNEAGRAVWSQAPNSTALKEGQCLSAGSMDGPGRLVRAPCLGQLDGILSWPWDGHVGAGRGGSHV